MVRPTPLRRPRAKREAEQMGTPRLTIGKRNSTVTEKGQGKTFNKTHQKTEHQHPQITWKPPPHSCCPLLSVAGGKQLKGVEKEQEIRPFILRDSQEPMRAFILMTNKLGSFQFVSQRCTWSSLWASLLSKLTQFLQLGTSPGHSVIC